MYRRKHGQRSSEPLEMSQTAMERDNAGLLRETNRYLRTSREHDDGNTISVDEEDSSRRTDDPSSGDDRQLADRIWIQGDGEGTAEGEHAVEIKMASKRGENCFGKCPPLRVVVTCVACFIVQFTLGVSYTTGNMLPYLTSYLRLRTDSSVAYAQTIWMSAGNTISMAVSMPVLGLIEKRMPPWAYRLMGIIFFCGSYLGASWAVKESFALTVFFLGGIHGVGQALLYPACLNLPLQWLPRRRGLLGGLIMAGYGGGGFLWDQIVTQWVNPHNLKPQVHVGEDYYFNQTTVLDNVPTCYILLGGSLSGVQILCLLCMAYPVHMRRKNGVINSDVIVRKNVISDSSPLSTSEAETGREREASPPPSSSSSPLSPSSSSPTPDVPESSTQGTTRGHDYSPRELFRSRALWTLTIFCFFVDLNVTIVLHFYKAYGQTFVHDDRLLSIMASFGAILNALIRPVWGVLADRVGFQPCLMTSQAILTFASAMLVVTKRVGAGLLFPMVCLIYVAIGGIYGTEYTLISILFGAKNFTFNLGIFNFTGVLSALIDVYVVDAAKTAFGWNGIFLAAAAFSLTAMVINWTLVCDCGHPLPAHMENVLFQARRPASSKRRDEDTDTRVRWSPGGHSVEA